MNAATPIPNGWPFLIARGRHRGHRILLAPRFLVADGEYGLLEEAVSPGAEPGRPQVIGVTTRARRRRLTVAYTTHRVTAADVAESADAQRSPDAWAPTAGSAAAGSAEAEPRDEHSRPLTLLYGFVCADGQIAEPAAEDLGYALNVAIEVYRGFFADENGDDPNVVAAGPFPLRSRVAAATPTTPLAAMPASPAVRSPPATGRPRPSPWYLMSVVLTVAIVVVLAVMWTSRSGHREPPPCLTPDVREQSRQAQPRQAQPRQAQPRQAQPQRVRPEANGQTVAPCPSGSRK